MTAAAMKPNLQPPDLAIASPDMSITTGIMMSRRKIAMSLIVMSRTKIAISLIVMIIRTRKSL